MFSTDSPLLLCFDNPTNHTHTHCLHLHRSLSRFIFHLLFLITRQCYIISTSTLLVAYALLKNWNSNCWNKTNHYSPHPHLISFVWLVKSSSVSDYKLEHSDLYILSTFRACRAFDVSSTNSVAASLDYSLDQVRDISVNILGQYIYIQKRKDAPNGKLAICEIEVIGTLISIKPDSEPTLSSTGSFTPPTSIVSCF